MSGKLADDYIQTTFTVEDGLPDNVINAITETTNGLLWVGTDSALASFDGRQFNVLSLRFAGAPSQGSIHALLESSRGDLWVGTDAGIVLIPKQALSFARDDKVREDTSSNCHPERSRGTCVPIGLL